MSSITLKVSRDTETNTKTQLITFGDGQPANLNDLEFSMINNNRNVRAHDRDGTLAYETIEKRSSSGKTSLSLTQNVEMMMIESHTIE